MCRAALLIILCTRVAPLKSSDHSEAQPRILKQVRVCTPTNRRAVEDYSSVHLLGFNLSVSLFPISNLSTFHELQSGRCSFANLKITRDKSNFVTTFPRRGALRQMPSTPRPH